MKDTTKKLIEEKVGEFLEIGANLEHNRWSSWQAYLYGKCVRNEDGSLTIPVDSVRHWQRQIDTPYAELSEPEKESDRREVRTYLPLLRSSLEDVALVAREEAQKEWFDAGWEEGREAMRKELLEKLPINELQRASMKDVAGLTLRAHFTNLLIRVNGKDVIKEADGLKHLLKALLSSPTQGRGRKSHEWDTGVC